MFEFYHVSRQRVAKFSPSDSLDDKSITFWLDIL